MRFRRSLAPVLAFALLALTQAGCNPKLCAALAKGNAVAQQILPVADMLVPALAPAAAAEYAGIRTLVTASVDAALASCSSGSPDQAKLLAAADALTKLLAWWQTNHGAVTAAMAAKHMQTAVPSDHDVAAALAALENARK